jgi:anti-anti-sigma factor
MSSHQTSRFPASRLQMQATVSERCHRLILSGELDLAGADELRSVILSLCEGHIDTLVLDLRKLTFLDSSGARVVLFTRDLCQEQGCDFLVVPGPAQVQLPFELCGPFAGVRFVGYCDPDSTSNAGLSSFDRQVLGGGHR